MLDNGFLIRLGAVGLSTSLIKENSIDLLVREECSMASQGQSTRKRKRGDIRLKNFVRRLLDLQGYKHVRSRDLKRNMSTGKPLYTINCNNGRGVFGSGYRVSFTLYKPISYGKPLCIQCRWQGVSGSTDRKLVFDVESIKIGKCDTYVIIEGAQFKPPVEMWLRGCAGKNRLNQVFRSRAFYRFVKAGRL